MFVLVELQGEKVLVLCSPASEFSSLCTYILLPRLCWILSSDSVISVQQTVAMGAVLILHHSRCYKITKYWFLCKISVIMYSEQVTVLISQQWRLIHYPSHSVLCLSASKESICRADMILRWFDCVFWWSSQGKQGALWTHKAPVGQKVPGHTEWSDPLNPAEVLRPSAPTALTDNTLFIKGHID